MLFHNIYPISFDAVLKFFATWLLGNVSWKNLQMSLLDLLESPLIQ